MRILTLITLAITLGGLHTACSSCGEQPVTRTPFPKGAAVDKLTKTPAGLEIKDSVDIKSNIVDYRRVVPAETGKAKLDFDFGEDHGLTGKVAVMDLEANEIVGEAVTTDEAKYTLEWDAEADTTYIAMVEATKGKGNYALEFSVTPPPPRDPCDGVECGEDEECQADTGKCIEVKPVECTPKCKSGQSCVDGKCVAPCGGKCPSGQICNRRTDECVKDPCSGKVCPEGQRCSGGVCKEVAKPTTCSPKCKSTETCNTSTLKCEPKDAPPATCNPPCGEGKKCQGTTCVDEGPPAMCGPVGAGVVQVIPNGNSSIVILNKGAAQNVKVGQTGKIANVGPAFKITEVYPVRSKAVIDADAATIGNNKGATIQREACP